MRKTIIRITSIILITIMLLSMTLTAFAEEPSNINASQDVEHKEEKSDNSILEDDIPKEVEDQLLAQINSQLPRPVKGSGLAKGSLP